jgi:thiol:disulfide interchange protein DsbA
MSAGVPTNGSGSGAACKGARVKRIFALLLLLLGGAQGLLAAPVEGRDYKVLANAAATMPSGKVLVTEFFSYQCPHCFKFSKPFSAWSGAQPRDVLVERLPVAVGRPAWELAARAYFALEAMGSLQQADAALFEAIHVQHQKLGNREALLAWVTARGLDTAKFTALLDSPAVQQQVKAADARVLGYRIPGIPAIVVDGRYFVEIHPSKDLAPQFAIVEALVARARSERTQGAK